LNTANNAQQVLDAAPMLIRYAHALCTEENKIQQTLSEALQHALAKLHRRDPEIKLRTWLFAIAHKLLSSDSIEPKRPKGVYHICGSPARKPLSEVDIFYDSFSMEQRAVIYLTQVEEFNLEETAYILHLPTYMVNTLLDEARDALGENLATITEELVHTPPKNRNILQF